ncbi:hypothetical protein D7B12_18000 [Salmonella enterica]|nr:hypothetical protein [Salmonella enterica]
MHDTALSEKEAHSFLDLLWRYANEQVKGTETTSEPKIIIADADKTVIQEIRRWYDERPFILDFDGIQIEVPLEMSLVDAMRAGMDATLSQTLIKKSIEADATPALPEPQPVKRRKTIVKVKAEKASESKAAPLTLKRKKPVEAPVIEDVPEEDDQTKYIGLQTYGVNPGEPLSRAVARVWPHRPALLSYQDKTIPITAEMSLVDAQIEAADVVGIDGNQVDSAPKITSSGFLQHVDKQPFDIAKFNFPIPVDDSEWNVSFDRNSGAEYVYTERSVWLDDYPFRISCIPFDEYMNTKLMFYVHCKTRPSQAMFDCYHELFRNHTHKVHVRQSNPSGDGSRILTHEYCSWRPKDNGTEQAGHVISTVMEALGMNARWEPGARYRIRYWDTNVNCVNHRYYSSRPNEAALATLKHPKLKPVIQSRPAGI